MSGSLHPQPTPASSRMFLFTDIEDSTRLWQSAPGVMQVALARHDSIMRDGIASHGGEVFKTAGDAFYAAFPDLARAIRNNLPAERDAFVGRAAELHSIACRLDDGERLLTLVGPAGTGKTRIVCRYGRAGLGDRPGASLAIHRELGDRHFEGMALSNLSGLYQVQGRTDDALATCRQALAILHEIGSRLGLAKFLCHRGQAEARLGDRDAAGAARDEAERIAAAIGAGPDSELGGEVATLRAAVGAVPG